MISDILTFFKELPSTAFGSVDIIPDSIEKSILPIAQLFEFIKNLDTGVKIGIAVVTLILALIGCFFGFKLSKFFMSLTGFIFGAVAGFMLGSGAFELSIKYCILCAAAGAILMAFAAFWIYKIGIFILCFVFAFYAAATFIPLTGDMQFFVSTVIGLLVGAIALWFIRPVIIITSAAVCGVYASGVIANICNYTGYTLPVESLYIGAGLAVAGLVVQFLTTRDEASEKRKRRKKARKERKKNQ